MATNLLPEPIEPWESFALEASAGAGDEPARRPRGGLHVERRARGGAARRREDRDAEGKRVCFGDFELDLEHGELRERDLAREIHRTPMRLLVYLVRHADRTVSKDELLEQVWEGTFVSDTAIASALKELRRALHDDGAHQRVIQTRRGSGYRFVAPLRATDDAPALVVRDSGAPSLAVLPLENVSRDREGERLALGMTEALIGALARRPSLRVLSRAAVMRLPDRVGSVRGVGRELGADLLVTGSITLENSRVRVFAELLDVESERLLWTEHYDRDLDRPLDVETEVAEAVEREIRRVLETRAADRAPGADALDPATQSAYLVGHYQYRLYTPERVAEALGHFLDAAQWSPDHAAAHAAVAECHLALCSEFGAISPEKAVSHAGRAVDRALELDARLGRAHAVRGALLAFFEWRWAEAQVAFRRAVELAPRDPCCAIACATFAAALGRSDQSIALARRALAIDPLDLRVRLQLARVLWCARRYTEALAEQVRVAAMDPSMTLAEAEIGTSLHRLGHCARAVAHWRRAMTLSGVPARVVETLDRAFERGGIDAYWRCWIELADELGAEAAVPASWSWIAPAATGDLDRAMEGLERSVERRAATSTLMHVDPNFDALRSHSGFDALLVRIGLVGECGALARSPKQRPSSRQARQEMRG